MRIVIDMQGAQTGSRFRGIGRYTLSLAKGIVRNRGNHEIILALSGLFPETIESLYEEFDGLLPRKNIKVWNTVGPTLEMHTQHAGKRVVAEYVREAFLSSLSPDVVLVTSLFEGLSDNAIGSIGVFDNTVPTAVILYDLIPLINPDIHFRNSQLHQQWYKRKIKSLIRSQMLLAISESAREEALFSLGYDPESVINISGAYDSFFHQSDVAKKNKDFVWEKLGIRKPFVMYTGGADERKNLKRLIMAFAQLPSKVRNNHQLVFAGKMPDDSIKEYLAVAKQYGIPDSDLILTGYISDENLLTLYNTCAVFVFPSLHEGFGIPPLEAMACGAAVIGSNTTSLPEVLGSADAMFDPTSVPEILAKIKQALTDEIFHAHLVSLGTKQCRKFSWDESAKRAIVALEKFDLRIENDFSNQLVFEKTTIFDRRNLKILAIKLDHLGDFILAIPALSKLRAKYPYALIDIVVGSWNVTFAEKLGFFNCIYTYDFHRRKSSDSSNDDLEESLKNVLQHLDHYDIAIDFRRQPDTRFFLVKTKAKMKVGYQTFISEIDCQMDVSLVAYPDIPYKASPLNETHISNQMIYIVDAIPSEASDYVTYPAICSEVTHEPNTVAIFPKAGRDAKEWGSENFMECIDLLLGNPNIHKINVYFANHNEGSEFCFKPEKKMIVHIGLNLGDLIYSLAKNALCIANDSGGSHLAAYLGVPVISLYSGHERAAEWAPPFFDGYVIHRAAECSPCHGGTREDCPNNLFCLSDITVKDVYYKSLEMLKKNQKQPNINNSKQLKDKITFQDNAVSLVRKLIKSISSSLKTFSPTEMMTLSRVIAYNHPDYNNTNCVVLGKLINHRSSLVDWLGFSDIEPGFRWSLGHHAKLSFNCITNINSSAIIKLFFNTFGEQRIIIHFNGATVFEGTRHGNAIELDIIVSNLRINSNELEFELPDACPPSNSDQRIIAIAFRTFKIIENASEEEKK